MANSYTLKDLEEILSYNLNSNHDLDIRPQNSDKKKNVHSFRMDESKVEKLIKEDIEIGKSFVDSLIKLDNDSSSFQTVSVNDDANIQSEGGERALKTIVSYVRRFDVEKYLDYQLKLLSGSENAKKRLITCVFSLVSASLVVQIIMSKNPSLALAHETRRSVAKRAAHGIVSRTLDAALVVDLYSQLNSIKEIEEGKVGLTWLKRIGSFKIKYDEQSANSIKFPNLIMIILIARAENINATYIAFLDILNEYLNRIEDEHDVYFRLTNGDFDTHLVPISSDLDKYNKVKYLQLCDSEARRYFSSFLGISHNSEVAILVARIVGFSKLKIPQKILRRTILALSSGSVAYNKAVKD